MHVLRFITSFELPILDSLLYPYIRAKRDIGQASFAIHGLWVDRLAIPLPAPINLANTVAMDTTNDL